MLFIMLSLISIRKIIWKDGAKGRISLQRGPTILHGSLLLSEPRNHNSGGIAQFVKPRAAPVDNSFSTCFDTGRGENIYIGGEANNNIYPSTY